MPKYKSKIWIFSYFLLILFDYVDAELRSQTFDLPSLWVHVDQLYLIKRNPTNLSCQLSPGYSEAKLSTIDWLKNGELLERVKEKIGGDAYDDYQVNGETLTLHNARQYMEGEYQCVADVSDIRLSNKQLIQTRLVSSPILIRRARITKFDKIRDHVLEVRRNEIARLPCAGLPDVIPGPPKICFEKLGSAECLGSNPNDTRFLATSTGLQISMAQPEDKGLYHCVVRNDYINQTRRSPKPVILYVKDDVIKLNEEQNDAIIEQQAQPEMVFPLKNTTIDKPIIVDAARGEDVILECVISRANIVWIKQNDTTPIITLNDREARVYQEWGNLRINKVTVDDSGIYACIGLSLLDSTKTIEETTQPRVYYNLVVHAPTAVNLTLVPQPDKSIVLECTAYNLRYEIPMAFVNGTALIDSIEQMGVPSNTDFFTNPIRVQMQVKTSFSGSVQCISRPAMEEAEVYGKELERGKSMNQFVMSSKNPNDDLIITGPTNLTVRAGQNTELPCIVQRVKSKYWMKDKGYVKIFGGDMRFKVAGSNSLKISQVQKSDEGWYTCVVTGVGSQQSRASAYLAVVTDAEALRTTQQEKLQFKKKDDKLIVDDVKGFVSNSDVRLQWTVLGSQEALNLIKKFKIEVKRNETNSDYFVAEEVSSHVRASTIKQLFPNNQYKFRVRLVREDDSEVLSSETKWMKIDLPDGDVIPPAPMLESLEMISETSAQVTWNHTVPFPNAIAKHFIIMYFFNGSENGETISFDGGSTTQAVLPNLVPDSTYTIQVIAENLAGKSPPSNQMNLNTTASQNTGVMTTIKSVLHSINPHLTFQTAAIVLCLLFVTLLVMLICCVVFCNIRSPSTVKTQANGKFLDTSYRIFNEQKKFDDRRNSKSSDKFPFVEMGHLPNVYGTADGSLEFETNEPDDFDPQRNSTFLGSTKIPGTGMYTSQAARCYSPDSGTSHEVIVPLTTRTSAILTPPSQLTGSPQRVVAYKCPDALLYSPAGTSSSVTESSSGVHTNRNNCDSPTQAL
ncbi:hypothetical protein WR25_21221 [Diploscapter pachys]|uniref:Uncharacterized protein n=1 Tax=Diploscapter pachys TaxID=2018661 RepID=A0A2A2LSM8_9BILA|nr:hypothetical protein WR25_21221 [Diploscapter pachys]